MNTVAPTMCCGVKAFWKYTKLSIRVTAFRAVVVMAECRAPNLFVNATAQLPPKNPEPQYNITAPIAHVPWFTTEKERFGRVSDARPPHRH